MRQQLEGTKEMKLAKKIFTVVHLKMRKVCSLKSIVHDYNSRYEDYPITDVLQMVGRANRPLEDNEGNLNVLNFCNSPLPQVNSQLFARTSFSQLFANFANIREFDRV